MSRHDEVRSGPRPADAPGVKGRLLAVVASSLLVVGVLVGLLVADPVEGGPDPVLATDSPVLLAGSAAGRPAAPKASATTVATLPPLPQPAMPPDDPYAPEPDVVVGTIEIPRLGVAETLRQGLSLVTIDRGPSHWPGTALPGQLGNVVVAGHRVTHSKPFRHLDQLVAGDQVVFTVAGARHVYEVTGAEVVTPDAVRIVSQTHDRTGTLFACHPPGSASHRYVVHLRYVG
ncbi:MAG: class E sortase [Acidimicrobiales bacterium]|nr:class E sortase [Acidimicrobiales bacterium]